MKRAIAVNVIRVLVAAVLESPGKIQPRDSRRFPTALELVERILDWAAFQDSFDTEFVESIAEQIESSCPS